MTKKEIVKTISEEIGLTQLKTKEIVQKTFDAIIETLVADGRIELRNFGVFEVKKRKSRKARNPRTGDKVEVPEKFVVTFKPGKEMEKRVKDMERKANSTLRTFSPNWNGSAGNTMTKKEIVKTISEEIGLTQLKTKEIVQKTFDAIIETLVADGRIELRNFGVFEVKKRKSRKARNPRTGDKVEVPEKFVVTFKSGKEMEKRVKDMERKANNRPPVGEAGQRPDEPGGYNYNQSTTLGFGPNPPIHPLPDNPASSNSSE